MLPPFRTSLTIAALAAGSLTLAACGDGGQPSAKAAPPPTCPKTWRGDWQRLSNQIRTPVYCPSWMPSPLDASMSGTYANGRAVSKDGSFLVSFVSVDHDAGGVTGEVHVNFRAYPGHTAIPECQDTITENGVTRHTAIPCFADRRWTKQIGNEKITAYTANQGSDQWHVLYAWRRAGTLYALSEHVTPPYSYSQVVANLNRMMRGLVLLRPAY